MTPISPAPFPRKGVTEVRGPCPLHEMAVPRWGGPAEEHSVIDPKEMQTVAAGRAKTYAVLAALYAAPPTAELAATICAGGLAQETSGALTAAADELTACFLRAASEQLPDSEIVAEHTRLFMLPFGVVPHESFYVDEKKHLGGRVTVGVQRYYDAAAAKLTGACIELPDHMGVELEFMKFLCDIEAQLWQESNWEGLQTCLEFQTGFLGEHLLQWHRALCERILGESALDLYRALARLTIDFLEAERVFVPELAGEVCSEGRTACLCES